MRRWTPYRHGDRLPESRDLLALAAETAPAASQAVEPVMPMIVIGVALVATFSE